MLSTTRRMLLSYSKKSRNFALKSAKDHLPLFLQLQIIQTIALKAKNPDWLAYLGMLREKRNDYNGAVVAYKAAVEMSDQLDQLSINPNKQAYQFCLEKARYNAGQPHAHDPLIFCNYEPLQNTRLSYAAENAGKFSLKFKQSGLLIKAKLSKYYNLHNCDYVELLIDNVPFRQLKVSGDTRELKYTVKRPALAHFPTKGELTVRTSDGYYLTLENCTGVTLSIPHGSGKIFEVLDKFGCLDKKGYVPSTEEEIYYRQNEYLRLYSDLKDFFDKEIGKPLFLMYGTLLGLYRDGDFIPNDDDFDVGYVSQENDPVSVKEEVKLIIEKLVKAGYTVAFNQAGRPFRVFDENNIGQLHLDVRPVWLQEGKTWAHLQACLPCSLEDFEPVQTTTFRGVEVYIPQNPENFLTAYYGPGWKVPDPNYSNKNVEVDPMVLENLSKACLTTSEFKKMKRKILNNCANNSKMGDLVFKSIEDLYPLEEYEAKFGWN